jgi:transposase
MLRKVKYDYEFKLRCVNEVLKKCRSIPSIAKETGVHASQLKKWVAIHSCKGRLGLLPTPKQKQKYSSAFKLNVLTSIWKKSLSLRAACFKFSIPSESTIITWQKQYAKEGMLGLERKAGRSPTMLFKRAKKKSSKPLTREEELLRENEILRAENALLKKLQALIQAEEAKENKRRKPL